ncbi:hypothetical protein FACS1894160_3700 [Bacteroidia bacterium]|nr:hypothetical protein FACS1894123_08610 [Bacteroidia bacterium]GHV08804.1 hypothetical protein FACS1894160_3700 [Bacteroidia bacterium]
MKKFIFLLGGYDLEMLEIKKILESVDNVTVFDKQLNWQNAHLSMYKDVLQEQNNRNGVEIYGIELQETGFSPIPGNYHRIDHHNDFSSNPSSLEQVAAILHIELSRKQQLIAANDKGYIPEMQKRGASPNEIEQIRFSDREMQGVTEEDEQKAKEAIENKIEKQGIIVVKSETNRFSPITDRLFPYEKLLIYTDDELMYYGQGKKDLAKNYEAEIKAGKMFHGGTARGVFSKEEIISLKECIIQTIKKL